MNDRQNAKLRMYQNVLNVCNECKQKYAGIPALENAVNELDQRVLDIKLATQQQTESSPKGATKEKNSAIDNLTELSLKIANSLYVYGFDTGNRRLLEKVSVNKRMFYNVHEQTALTLAKIIAAEAKANGGNLLNYGINASDITDLDAAIAQVSKLINTPAGVIGERKMHTSNIKELFVAADSVIYDKLDKLIRLFKISSPEFFTLYSNARNIVDTAARRRKSEPDENG